MSKIQSAIDAAKEKARIQASLSQSGTYVRARSKPYTMPVRLERGPMVLLSPPHMERNCLMPFLADKNATSAYNVLRTRVLQRMRENGWQSVIVTGTMANEGKTTTAINLAMGISQDVSQTVLLADMDLSRPSVASCLGIRGKKSLGDYLAGTAEAQEVIYNTDVDRLLVLPNFTPVHTSESLVSPRMMAMFDHIKALDPELLIVFDLPPILQSDSVVALGPHVDCLLLVVSEGRTNRSLLGRASHMIENIPRLGTLLNRSSEGNTGGYYY
jgi:Mrp family chromosome partitioning ATPase